MTFLHDENFLTQSLLSNVCICCHWNDSIVVTIFHSEKDGHESAVEFNEWHADHDEESLLRRIEQSLMMLIHSYDQARSMIFSPNFWNWFLGMIIIMHVFCAFE